MSGVVTQGKTCLWPLFSDLLCVPIYFILPVVPCEDTSDDIKDSFYEELGRVFDQFPRYDMKILLGDGRMEEVAQWGTS
jgi:hypothetical protein